MVKEIEEYLKTVMDLNEEVIEMSDNPIKSPGAQSVAAAINFCKRLTKVNLANCQIRDVGAKALFNEIASSKTVTHVDLTGNPITERCFDAVERMLATNPNVQHVALVGAEVRSQFAKQRFKKFGNRVVF